MKLEVEKKQVMKKCHYCLASDWDGKCVFDKEPHKRIPSCTAAVKRLVEAEKGGGSDA